MTFSIRHHCIPAHDFIRNVEAIQPLPTNIADMEEKTAGGICLKVKKILNSEYFASLPNKQKLDRGFVWKKTEQEREANRIVAETGV